jgi:2'-5' RNA ligase
VADRSLHVTLAFIGRRSASEVEPITQALTAALNGRPAPRLAATAAVPVPRRRPRLVALDLDDRHGRAADAQAAISEALSHGGWYEPETRSFWPHITFARVKRGAREVAAIDEPPPPAEPFSAQRVTLYRSHLSPRGAQYEALARVRLGR